MRLEKAMEPYSYNAEYLLDTGHQSGESVTEVVSIPLHRDAL